MNKAICITIPVELIEIMQKQHINKSELIEELLRKHFNVRQQEPEPCETCKNIAGCDSAGRADARVLSCSSYEKR